jgi:hypothetical protein
MLNEIEDGSGISMVVMINGKPEKFQLAVFDNRVWEKGDEPHYEFGFVNSEGTKYFRNPYSGGNTGFGVNQELKDVNENYRLVTTDIEMIKHLIISDREAADVKANSRVREQEELVLAINALPERFTIDELGTNWYFERTTAFFNPGNSSKVYGGDIVLRDVKGVRCVLAQFVARDGHLLNRKFKREVESVFGKEITEANSPKVHHLLKKIIDRRNELFAMVKGAGVKKETFPAFEVKEETIRIAAA